MCINNLLRRLAPALASAALLGCAPLAPDGPGWTLANATADTLRVCIRYPLDSVELARPGQLELVRQSWERDSGAAAGRGFSPKPLWRLAAHRGRWYAVDSRVAGLSGAPLATGGRVRSDRRHGLLTYTLPPHSSQPLLRPGYSPVAAQVSVACLQALWLEQGATRRRVLPGRAFADVFRPARPGRATASRSRPRYQLTVGPGLTITD